MTLNWIPITSLDQVENIIRQSWQTPCLIFKHSTRCQVSAIAKYRLEDDWNFGENELSAYFLDILAYRQVSNHIADVFQVHHESPQALLLHQGECTFDTSHLDITIAEIREALSAVSAT